MNSDLQTLLDQGQLAQREGRVADAEQWLRQAAAAAPRQPQPWFSLGDVLEDLQRWPEAEACYARTAALAPQVAVVHYRHASMLRQLGRPAEALSAIRRALAIDAGAADALQLKAMLEEESGALAAALSTLDQALDLAPQRAALHHNRAVVLQRLQRHAEALAAHLQAQALGLNVADAHYNHGNSLQSLGRTAEAVAAYRRALALAPQHGLALYDLARLRWALGDADFTAELDAAALQSPAASGIKAQLLLKAERPAEAAEAYRQALLGLPAASGYHDGLGLALSALGQHAAALAAHAQAVALAPRDATVHSNHAHSLLAAGDPAAAAAQAEAALALAPDDQHALALLGLAWRQLGDPRERWLNDETRFVRAFDLPPPDGFADMAAFNLALAAELGALHTDRRAPVDQTLRHGTQTRGNLLDQGCPLVERLKPQLAAAISRYIAELPEDASHPLLRRRSAHWHFTDSWSSRLTSGGFHTNHVHTHGWISASYYVALPPAVSADGHAGWIQFGEPDMALGLSARLRIQPAVGRLVLFPSSMWHGTVPFEVQDEVGAVRLTIAFDVKPGAA
ncbi:MAG: tetratricopeptide repeat protein [Microbacteriaceae bacterium]|nr:tetratricopeptide repeat protein [Burkholderiaceae bacterium]